MRELWKLNPYIAKYPHLLLGGIVFIFFTNVFAVYAPSLIGEGVNAMKAVDQAFLAPLREGQSETEVFAQAAAPEFPRTLEWIRTRFEGGVAEWAPLLNGKQDALAWMKRLAFWQAGLFLLAYLLKGIFLFFTRQTIIVMSHCASHCFSRGSSRKTLLFSFQGFIAKFHSMNISQHSLCLPLAYTRI